MSLVDALETLLIGEAAPAYADAWVKVYTEVHEKAPRILRSFPEEVREQACVDAITKLRGRKKPLRAPIEDVAHKYVHITMRRCAIDIANRLKPTPPPPPQPPPPPPPPSATDEDVRWFFDELLPKVASLYAMPHYIGIRFVSLSVQNLLLTAEELRRVALREQPVKPDGADESRAAYRKRCQRAMKSLRSLIPLVWFGEGWCPPVTVGPNPSLQQLWRAVSDLRAPDSRLERTILVLARLTAAYHIERRGQSASGE